MATIRLFGQTVVAAPPPSPPPLLAPELELLNLFVAATPPTVPTVPLPPEEEELLALALAPLPAKQSPALPSATRPLPAKNLPPTPPPAEDPVLSWLATFLPKNRRAPQLLEKDPSPPPGKKRREADTAVEAERKERIRQERREEDRAPGKADTAEVEAVEDRKEKAWPPLPPRGRAIWHYTNPRGQCKGPYSITALRSWGWRDPCVRVWRRGSSPGDSVRLLTLIDYYDEAASAGDVRQWMFDDMNGGPRSLDELRRRIARRQLQPGLKVWILGQPKERVMLSDLVDDVDVAAPEDKAVKDKEIKMPKRVDPKEEERRKRWTRREAEAERRRAEEDDRHRHRHRHRDRDGRGKAPRRTPSPPRGSGASCSEPRGRPEPDCRMPMRMR